MISQECPHCHNALQIPDQYAGQKGSCKKCGGEFVVSDNLATLATQVTSRNKWLIVPSAIFLFLVLVIILMGTLWTDTESNANTKEPISLGGFAESPENTEESLEETLEKTIDDLLEVADQSAAIFGKGGDHTVFKIVFLRQIIADLENSNRTAKELQYEPPPVFETEEWHVVGTWSGKISRTTDYFRIPSSEWRVSGEVEPISSEYEGSFWVAFSDRNDRSAGMDSFVSGAAENVSYHHGLMPGDFYAEIQANQPWSFTIEAKY